MLTPAMLPCNSNKSAVDVAVTFGIVKLKSVNVRQRIVGNKLPPWLFAHKRSMACKTLVDVSSIPSAVFGESGPVTIYPVGILAVAVDADIDPVTVSPLTNVPVSARKNSLEFVLSVRKIVAVAPDVEPVKTPPGAKAALGLVIGKRNVFLK